MHKSALIENVLRTLSTKHVLMDLNELSIFRHGTWSPERFLRKLYPLTLVKLSSTIASFYTLSLSTV